MGPTEDFRRNRAASRDADAKPSSSLCALAALLLALALALPASAGSGDNMFESLPQNFRYTRDYDFRPPAFSYRRSQEQSVQAPTKFRIKSILKYTTRIGNSGFYLRLQVPLKKRKIVKVEIRF